MKLKEKIILYIIIILLVIGLIYIYMINKTFDPTLSTKFLVKDKILSMMEEENDIRVIHLVKTKDKLILINYKKIDHFLYLYQSKTRSSLSSMNDDVKVDYFFSNTSEDSFTFGFCKNTDINKLVFTFQNMDELEVVPNAEGIFLLPLRHMPQEVIQILGYTDSGEIINVFEYIPD